MTLRRAEDGGSAAARLLQREQFVAMLAAGQDILFEGAVGASLACLHGPLLSNPKQVGLALVPDGGHALCRAAQASNLPVKAVMVTPDSTDEERRALGVALQNHTAQLILVTPDRLGQPRFIDFIQRLSLAYVAVAACQRLLPDAITYHVPYTACRALRGHFPGIPIVALADEPLVEVQTLAVARALGMTLPVAENRVLPAAVPPEPAVAPVVSNSPRGVPESYRQVFALFDANTSVKDAALQLAREEAWVWQALESFIKDKGRSHPFPWVSKPVYMTVSMAAGQAETMNARLLASVLRDQVEEGPLRAVLAALQNRNGLG